MHKITGYFEDFKVYKAALSVNNEDYFEYAAPSSLHSGITTWGYGTVLSRRCVRITDAKAVTATALVPEESARFTLKMICCLEEWQKYVNDIKIKVNDTVIYEYDKEFIENVNLGWPALYYDIPNGIVKAGMNKIEISTENSALSGLLISEISLIALPEIPHYSQVSYYDAAKCGEKYSVAVFAGNNSFREIKSCENCTLVDVQYFFGDICVLSFVSEKPGKAYAKVCFEHTVISLDMPQIYKNRDFCLVGIDCDDHRHDMSSESKRIKKVFQLTGMGNYFLFRPQRGRNYWELAPEKVTKEQIEFFKSFGTRIGITDYSKVMPYLYEFSDENYYATSIHEPYLFFNYNLEKFEHVRKNYLNNAEKMRSCETFGESEQLYRDVLQQRIKNVGKVDGVFASGSPSLLSVYEAEAGFDKLAIEPVSNMNLLAGTVRHLDSWGAHVPTDWYFGAPNNACKSRKFRLALYYLYLNGASFIYPENAVFKTNAFSREDWESEFCSCNRQYLREFYSYTIKNERIGEQIVDKAIIYGNHEHFFWQNDDRIAELNAEKDWDSLVWGKWEDKHRKCWKAAEGWLPIAEKQSEPYDTPVNKNLFSGTPYGNVDVVSCKQSWDKYKTIAFLGWNTMTSELLEKLKCYIENGGTAVISYCHFNMTDRNDREMTFPSCDAVSALLGVDIQNEYLPEGTIILNDGNEISVDENITAVRCKPVSAKMVASDSAGNGLIFRNSYGKGTIYFCAFKDYFIADWSVLLMKKLLESIGKAGDIECDNPNVFISRRDLGNGKERVDMLNMNCAESREVITANLRLHDKEYICNIPEGEVYSMEI